MKNENKNGKKEKILGAIAEGFLELFGEILIIIIGCAIGVGVLALLGINYDDLDSEALWFIGFGVVVVVVLIICFAVNFFERKRGGEDTHKRIVIRSRKNKNISLNENDESLKKIIFDTDIGGDCDDAGALATIHRAEQRGLVKLLAVTVSTGDPWAPACADAINRYYGHEVPVGACAKAPVGDPTMKEFEERYGKHIAETFPNRYIPKRDEIPEDAVRLMRSCLAKNCGEKITLIVVGSCLNLANLIKSEGDDISPLTGIEFIESQADKVVLMGGLFADEPTPEYNIKTDIPSAKTVFEKCPVPIFVSHFDVGLRVMSGGKMIEEELKNANPAAEAYRFHVGGKRHSWDPIAAFYAVYGCDGVFTDERCGKVTVLDDGVTVFEEGNGGRHILIDCRNEKQAEDALDRAMTQM